MDTDEPVIGHDAWWVIHSAELHAALCRAHRGEDPDVLYVELYANSEIESEAS